MASQPRSSSTSERSPDQQQSTPERAPDQQQPVPAPAPDQQQPAPAPTIAEQLSEAWGYLHEQPERALIDAHRCAAQAEATGDSELLARANALECAVAMHRGDMPEALRLTVEAERFADLTSDPTTLAELAMAKASFRLLGGALAEAIRQADLAVQCADESGGLRIRIHAREVASMVFGTVGVHDRLGRLRELLDLTLLAGASAQEALARNDIACHYQEAGELEVAERWIAQAREAAERIVGEKAFTLAVVESSHADIHLAAGRPEAALRSARESVRLLETQERPNPYVFAASVRVELQAQIALRNYEDAQRTGEEALGWLGDRLPRARAAVLSAYAEALREAGRHQEAYDAVVRALELERQGFRELSELQLILERATFDARLARSEADRDWLTGLYNRRFLARELGRISQERRVAAISVAAIDLDQFKSVNDQLGHSVGDRVLVHAANLVRRLTRDSDVTVRSGGEEFLIVMPHTEPEAARACCDRIHEAIRREDWDAVAPGLALTASIGVTSGDTPAEVNQLLSAADQHLYVAKRNGRDMVVADDHEA